MHTLDIAPLRSESPLQTKRSGMARVLKGYHSFTCTLTRSSAINRRLKFYKNAEGEFRENLFAKIIKVKS